jgi:hypothetical protein
LPRKGSLGVWGTDRRLVTWEGHPEENGRRIRKSRRGPVREGQGASQENANFLGTSRYSEMEAAGRGQV